MCSTGSVSSLEIAGAKEFEIAYAPLVDPPPALPLEAGWNLLGNPVMSIQSAETILDDGTRAAVNIGVIWYWNNVRYEAWTRDEPLSPERGYWVYCPADCETAPIRGVRADGIILLKPGWNLVSPASDCVMPAVDGIAGPAWRWDSRAYRAVSAGGTLEAGQGYWIYVSSDQPVMVDFGE